MKKVVLLLGLTMMLLCSGVVFADGTYDPLKDLLANYSNHVNDDGKVVVFGVSDSFVNLTGLNRAGWYSDVNGQNPQKAAVNITADAYIPCYIEMKVTGNQGQTTAESYGPGAEVVTGPAGGYWLLFDNEVGGFVDEGWNSMGHGKNAEIKPAPGVYIQGCDVFKVEIYANDTYKYEVESAPLNPAANVDISSANSNDVLDLQMRTSVDNNVWGAPVVFNSNIIAPIISKQACDSTVALHQFRVPYNRNTAHGQYTGVVTFRAVTI